MITRQANRWVQQQVCGLGLIAVLIGAGVVNAQDNDVDEVIVTAMRVDKPASQIPASVGLVGKDDVQLARPQLGLDESLGRIAGLFVQDRYNFAQDLRIAIRGFGARSNFGIRGVKIIVDGIPETLPDGQGQVDAIDLGSVERIEVIKGPASSLYGNASGGVVNIASEQGTEQPFVEARLTVGEDDFGKYQLKTGGIHGRLNYLLDVSNLSYDGYRAHSETENTQFNGRLGFEIDDHQDLVLVLNATDQPLANDPGGINQTQVDTDRRSARQRNVDFASGEALEQQKLGLVYTNQWSEQHQLRLRGYVVSRDFANRLPFVGGGAVEIDRTFAGGGATYTYSGVNNRLTIGVDLDRQDDDRTRFDNNFGTKGDLVFDQNEQVTSVGVFAQNELTVSDALALTLGVRYDRLEFKATDRFFDNGDDSGQRTLTEVSPMIGAIYTLRPGLNLFANVSTSFESPTTTEFANPSGAGGFNPNIDPQSAINYELGLKGGLGSRSGFELSLFQIDVEDELIPFELESQPGRDFFANAGESSRTGVEFALTSQPTDQLRIALAYTYSDFEFDRFVDGSGNDFSGNRLPGLPEHLVYGEVTYTHPNGFFGSWDIQHVSDLALNNSNSVVSDSYSLSNLRAGFTTQFGVWRLSPFAGVSNLFDETYSANVRINAFGGRFFEPAPERNVYGGLSLRYDF